MRNVIKMFLLKQKLKIVFFKLETNHDTDVTNDKKVSVEWNRIVCNSDIDSDFLYIPQMSCHVETSRCGTYDVIQYDFIRYSSIEWDSPYVPIPVLAFLTS